MVHLGILLPEAVVVIKVAARRTGTEAEEVEGTARSSPGGQGAVETLNQGNLVLLLMSLLVGMEATKATTTGGMTQPGV